MVVEHPPESPRLASDPTVAAPVRAHAHFDLWETVPSTTKLSALFATSLLILTSHPETAVLVRCSPGVEEGTAVMVHSDTSRPNALGMLGVEADSEIGAEAQLLAPGKPITVVAIPHITWKHPGGGPRWRAPLTVLGALAAALPVVMLAPPIGVVAAVPVAGVVAILIWLLLRTIVPTRIEPGEGSRSGIAEAVAYARSRMTPGAVVSPLAPSSAVLQGTPGAR